MPNPKLGSVSENIKEAVTNAKSGQVEIRNDKDGNLGVSIGKKSFHDDQLLKNFHAIIDVLEKKKQKKEKIIKRKKQKMLVLILLETKNK